jgi:hypothetical protein
MRLSSYDQGITAAPLAGSVRRSIIAAIVYDNNFKLGRIVLLRQRL